MLAALFSFSYAFAETGSEVNPTSATKNAKLDCQSFYIPGDFIPSGSGNKKGTMANNGLKLRTNSLGNTLTFTVNTPYTIKKLELDGYANDAGKDATLPGIKVTKVEVDGAETTFTGGEFPVSGASTSSKFTIENIAASQSITLTFDNSNVAKTTQIVVSWAVNWERPEATQPTITVSPKAINLIPTATYKLGVKVDPNTFTTNWLSNNEAIATVAEDGTVTAVAAGTAKIINKWADDAAIADTAVVTVNNFDTAKYKVVKEYDFKSMGAVTLVKDTESAGKIWNEANKVANAIYYCTNEGLENIAVQAVVEGNKGWSITEKGLFLATGAGRCAAIGNLKAGQIVEIIYTGTAFYTGSKNDAVRKDNGAAKTALNESIGRAIYQMDEDGLLGFEIATGNAVEKITIWSEDTGESVDPNDYTSYIVNADLTGEGGFDATGTKGISDGIVKVGNASAFDFKQTIANLPAGKYKVTAQAAYRFGADEAAEAAAITAGTDTKLVQLYATVGEKTVATKVQNRYDGASETDYANGSGSVTVNEKFVPNSSDAVKAWFAAGKYVNEVTFNLPADGAVTIGINRTGTPESDYTVIGPWTLTRLGDAEVEPEPAALLANGDFEGEFTVFASPKADRDIYQPAGWTVTYENGEENDMTALNSECKSWDNFSGKPQLGETGGKNNFWVRFRWGNSEKLTLSQKVTLAAGNYKLSADAFFNGANGASATISAAGQSAAIAGNSTWANHSVIFNLAEETEVTIALNVTQTQQVENIAAFDNVKLEAIEDIYADLKAEVATALETKQSVKTKTALETALATFTAEQNETNVDALKAALASAKTSINSYKILETGIIPDDKLDGWTCTNTNTFHINTWSGEGNSDGSNMKTPFIENWCNKNDGFLGTGEIYYSLPGLDPGIYSFSALIRAYSEAGNAPTGASLFAQNREKEFATGHSFVYNGMKGIYDTYTMSAEVGEDGVFKFGIKIAEERNFNWMAFKNCRVAYVGAAITEEAVNELATTMPEGKMNADVKKAAEDAIAAAKATIGIETYEAAQVAIAAAKVSVEAYAAANETLAKMKQFAEETNVYTAEALASYYTQWTEKYEANTLTTEEANALQDPYAQTGWQHDANMMIDDLLLSAWSIGEAKAKDYETALYINTWSIEGNNDGSDFKVPFFEYWTNDDKSLAENTLTATLNGVESGKYDVTAWVRVRAKNGYEAPATGITMQANDGEAVNVAAGDQVGTSQFFLKEFTATGTVAEDGVLKIKFNVAADNNISWLSFKNVMVTKNLGEPIFTLNAKVGEEVSIKPGVYDEFDVFTVDFGDGVLVTDSVGHQNKGVCFNDGTETWPQKEGTTHTSITEFKGTATGDGTIKVYGNSDIWYLAVTGATLAVDQPKLKKVVQFTMSKVAVESLDLTGLDNMEIFSFSQGSLKNINVKNNAALTKLTINNNTASAFESTLESLDLSGNTNLEELNVMAASATKPGVLKALDLSANTKLTKLYAQYNALESVILPENAALSFANLQNNKIAAIDLSKVASLKDTYLNNNLLTEVDLSKVVAGANLYLDGNQLTTVNVPVIVKNLQLNDNKLTSATIAGATASCKLENNAFTLATLPAQPAGLSNASKTKNFTYAPQAAMQVAETVSELDLTSQLTVAKGELNPEIVGEAAAYTTWLENQTTSFSFVTAGGNALVEGTDYEVVEPGKFKFLKAQEEKVHAVMLNAAFPKFTEAAPFTTTEFTVEAAEVLDPDLVEIPQDQGKTLDDFARTELVEGENYNTYTCTEGIQVAFKMFDIDVKNCDYVVVKFAEPVAAGWELAFWAKSDQSTVAVPAGATEYKYVFAEDAKCAIVDGVLPQICMLHLWTGTTPLVAKVKGVYKHQLPVADAISNITTDAQKTAVFNMNGQKVNKAQKGLFIINGKKTVIK